MMQEAGYRVGTFTSPSMEHHFDRIRINDEPLEEDFFLRAMREFDTWKQLGMTMFEIDFLIAAAYFYEKQVDLAVYEVGLGGEKDSTNVIAPLVCVITNIGKDHMELLGDTLEEIAAAKAGIIKRDTPLITAEDKPACLAVFAEACQKSRRCLHRSLRSANHVSRKKVFLSDIVETLAAWKQGAVSVQERGMRH